VRQFTKLRLPLVENTRRKATHTKIHLSAAAVSSGAGRLRLAAQCTMTALMSDDYRIALIRTASRSSPLSMQECISIGRFLLCLEFDSHHQAHHSNILLPLYQHFAPETPSCLTGSALTTTASKATKTAELPSPSKMARTSS
jgi:hypothetical protein